MDTAGFFRHRYALDAMHARLEPEGIIYSPAFYLDDGKIRLKYLRLEAAPRGVFEIHARQVTREKRRLIAARAGAEFHDDRHGFLAGRIILRRSKYVFHLCEKDCLLRLERNALLGGELGKRWIFLGKIAYVRKLRADTVVLGRKVRGLRVFPEIFYLHHFFRAAVLFLNLSTRPARSSVVDVPV